MWQNISVLGSGALRRHLRSYLGLERGNSFWPSHLPVFGTSRRCCDSVSGGGEALGCSDWLDVSLSRINFPAILRLTLWTIPLPTGQD
eukprot:817959-Amorphochlora_amoeboformis.AAC.2